MSRPLLLIICDFLLLSLLALARFDQPVEEAEPEPVVEQPLEQPGVDTDLIEVLQLSLEEEREEREELAEALSTHAETLDERESALQRAEEQRQQIAEEARQLSEDLERTRQEREREREALEQAVAERQRETERMREESAAIRERARMLQEQLQNREDALQRASEERQAIERERLALERDRERVESELRIREAEKGILEQNLLAARAEIETIRVEKEEVRRQADRLAEGVTELAERSTEFQEEIRQRTPLSPHEIFSSFRENRVLLRFQTREQRLIGSRDAVYETPGLFVTDGDSTYALFSNAETPFTASSLRNAMAINGSMVIEGVPHEIGEVWFLRSDPRILAVRVPSELVQGSTLQVFPLADDPLRFAEAVVIGRQVGGYGEASFRLHPTDRRYLIMERKLFRVLFGDFAPERGDLVFTKTGAFIGAMVDNTHTAVANSFQGMEPLQLGDAFREERARQMHSLVESRAAAIP